MNQPRLNYLQVATLLVSASFGIGFLFGSGELALTQGMAGSLYGLLTALGMLLLAVFAGRIWSKGLPIWDMLGEFYGPLVKRSVILLSFVWMTGVLAAQIQGSIAILTTVGLSQHWAMALSLVMIFGISRVNLDIASKIFVFFLFASSAVLAYVLFHWDGLSIYFEAMPRLASDIHRIDGKTIFVMTIGVVFLVVTGADYQQFVIAAKSRVDAVVGCGVAAIFLGLVSILPASAVIAAKQAGVLSGMTDTKQVIPFLISRVTAQIGQELEIVFLVGLLFAALGCGAAIVRAMDSAITLSVTVTVTGTPIVASPIRKIFSVAIIVVGGVIAARAQAIIDTIINLNIVYIASIAPLFICLLLGIKFSSDAAQKAIVTGFATSILFYAIKWGGFAGEMIDMYSLCFGVLASIFVLVVNYKKYPRVNKEKAN